MSGTNSIKKFTCNEEGFVINNGTIDIESNKLHCINCGQLNEYPSVEQSQHTIINGEKSNKHNINRLISEMLIILNKCQDEEYDQLKLYITQSLNKSQFDLFVEAKNGNEAAILTYVNNNLNLDIRDQFGNTFLHYVSIYGYTDTLKVLLKRVNVRTKNKNGSTPLHLAASNGHIQIINILLENGALIEARDLDGETAIYCAIINGDKNVVKNLLQKGADIQSKNDYLSTPLHVATLCDKPRIVKLLLKHGANLNCLNAHNESPLNIAQTRNYQDIIKMYMQK